MQEEGRNNVERKKNGCPPDLKINKHFNLPLLPNVITNSLNSHHLQRAQQILLNKNTFYVATLG